MRILNAEDFISPDVLTAILASNKRLWADAVEAMALKAMIYLQHQWPKEHWGSDTAINAVAHVYNAPDLRTVKETPIMRDVLEQVLAWIRKAEMQDLTGR